MVAFVAVFGILFVLFVFGITYMFFGETFNGMITEINPFITSGDITSTGAGYINNIMGIAKMTPYIFMIGLIVFCVVYAIEKKAV